MCKNSSRRTPRPQKMNMWYFEVKNAFFDNILKMKNVENGVLKVLICVRTHPEELLVLKNDDVVF